MSLSTVWKAPQDGARTMSSTSQAARTAPATRPVVDRGTERDAPSSMPRLITAGRDRRVVGVVAAYPSLRAGLATLIQSDPHLTVTAISPQVLSAASEMPGVAQLGQLGNMDVILVEPGDLAPDALHNLVTLSREDQIPVLWLGTDGIVAEALRSDEPGGVIALDADGDTLVSAIRAITRGLRVIDPHLAFDRHGGTSTSIGREPATIESSLSPREREVLGLVATGLPNKSIARSLGISDHTVKFHVSSVLTKLDAGSRTEAVTIATRMGILSL